MICKSVDFPDPFASNDPTFEPLRTSNGCPLAQEFPKELSRFFAGKR